MEEVIKRDSQLARDHVLLHIGWAKGAMPLSRAAMGAQLSCSQATYAISGCQCTLSVYRHRVGPPRVHDLSKLFRHLALSFP